MWPDANEELWQNQLRQAIRTPLELSEAWPECSLVHTDYPLFIPRPLLEKIKKNGIRGPLAKQFLPSQQEQNSSGLSDPIGDQKFAHQGPLIHRYQNRALLLPTTRCPVVCRYCFRKNELYTQDDWLKHDLQAAIDYLQKHPEIEELILSGGDPLILSQKKLAGLFERLASVKTLYYLRLHTRCPAILPTRMTQDLMQLLQSSPFKRLLLVVHLNHPDEIEPQVFHRLREFGVETLSQTVLLRGVNDDPEILVKLFRDLSALGVSPYYLHHPDPAQGTQHFGLSIERGRMIYAQLRNQLSGWMLPQYVLDLPEGAGKVPLFNPEGHSFSGQLMNKSGEFIAFRPQLH